MKKSLEISRDNFNLPFLSIRQWIIPHLLYDELDFPTAVNCIFTKSIIPFIQGQSMTVMVSVTLYGTPIETVRRLGVNTRIVVDSVNETVAKVV
jgi:hypothetical protein